MQQYHQSQHPAFSNSKFKKKQIKKIRTVKIEQYFYLNTKKLVRSQADMVTNEEVLEKHGSKREEMNGQDIMNYWV